MKTNYFFLLGLLFVLAGCSNAHLVYVHEAVAGISVTPVNPSSGTSKFVFGYDRETYALIPKKSENDDAMSLTAVSRVYARGLDEVQFGHVVATGNAAKAIAKRPDALKEAKSNLKQSQVQSNDKNQPK